MSTAPADRPLPRRVIVGGVAGVAALTAATLWGGWAAATARGLAPLDVAVAAGSCVLLAAAFGRRPVPAALALTALAALSGAGTPASTAAVLTVARRRPSAVAAVVAGAGVTAHVVRGLWRPESGLGLAWWVVLVVAAHAALLGWGSWARSRDALVGALLERAERAEAEQGRRIAEARAAERTRIAREMHDVLAHRLSLLATYAGALEYRPDAPPEQLARAAGVVRAGVHEALEELRDVITVLRDDDPEEHGDRTERPAPGWGDVERLVAEGRAAGAVVALRRPTGADVDPPPATGRAAYRIVQEALTNARRHAPGTAVDVGLTGGPGEGLTVEIRNPVGDAPAGPRPTTVGGGAGLVGVSERARLAGGRADHGRDGRDFVVRAWLPWPP